MASVGCFGYNAFDFADLINEIRYRDDGFFRLDMTKQKDGEKMSVKNAPILFLHWLGNLEDRREAAPIANRIKHEIAIRYEDVATKIEARSVISDWFKGNKNPQVLFIGAHGDSDGIGDSQATGMDWPELIKILKRKRKKIYLWLFACKSAAVANAMSPIIGKPPVGYIVAFPDSVGEDALPAILKNLVSAYSISRIVPLDEEPKRIRRVAKGVRVHCYYPAETKNGTSRYVETSSFKQEVGITFKKYLEKRGSINNGSILFDAAAKLQRKELIDAIVGVHEIDPSQEPVPASMAPGRRLREREKEFIIGNLAEIVPKPRGFLYPVWFGTCRKPRGNNDFSSERSGQIHLGKAEVWVPKSHKFGELGNPFWERLRRREWLDDNLVLERVQILQDAAFYAGLLTQMEQIRAEGQAPQSLVFIHGFNVSFKDAALRTAQLGCDLKIPGPVAFFSWPSRGELEAYPADEASIEASEAAITQFLLDFSARCGAEKVHLVAHSMGNRGLLRAFQRIAANVQNQGHVKFGQIFLAAPDVDRDLFLSLAHVFPVYAERTTLYASRSDKALLLSSKLHGAPRAGYYEPYTIAQGIDTIAVPDLDLNNDLFRHSYFAEAEAILYDIFDLICHGDPPDRRLRLRPVSCTDGSFWELYR